MTDETLDLRIDTTRARLRELNLDESGEHGLATYLSRLFDLRASRIAIAVGRRIAADHGADGECWPNGAHPCRGLPDP
jgi:hypothetical protein